MMFQISRYQISGYKDATLFDVHAGEKLGYIIQ